MVTHGSPGPRPSEDMSPLMAQHHRLWASGLRAAQLGPDTLLLLTGYMQAIAQTNADFAMRGLQVLSERPAQTGPGANLTAALNAGTQLARLGNAYLESLAQVQTRLLADTTRLLNGMTDAR